VKSIVLGALLSVIFANFAGLQRLTSLECARLRASQDSQMCCDRNTWYNCPAVTPTCTTAAATSSDVTGLGYSFNPLIDGVGGSTCSPNPGSSQQAAAGPDMACESTWGSGGACSSTSGADCALLYNVTCNTTYTWGLNFPGKGYYYTFYCTPTQGSSTGTYSKTGTSCLSDTNTYCY
jgi:hypothetical protein